MRPGAERQRREVMFHGRVQGVGFRATARDLAASYAVTGYVENLPVGSVRLVVEGEEVELDRFLAALSAEMGRLIESQQSRLLAALGEFSDFSIRR